jgi:hypothetical protein
MVYSKGLFFAVILAGIAIAAAVLFVGRWQIVGVGGGPRGYVYRLDAWTGEIAFCFRPVSMTPIAID